MGKGYAKMKKQAKLLQKEYQDIQNNLTSTEVIGISEQGLVKITLSGDKNMKKIEINPDCVDKSDVEGLCDLIISSYQNAVLQLDEKNNQISSLPFNL